MTSRSLVLVILVCLLGTAACKAQKEAFYARIFPCSSPGVGECGTTEDGAPMTCFSATALGGEQFCAESCDPTASSSPRPGTLCTSSGALLLTCEPTADGSATGSCPAGLSCYRTSLSSNHGVCIAMNVCAGDDDCSSARPICASSIIKAVLPPAVAAGAATDHLHCIQTGCKSSNMSCPIGEACIGKFLSFGPPVDDVCVPSCDDNRRCPPNFTCLHDPVSAPGGPKLCFPGMIGARCASPENCLAGVCTDVGVEFGICSVPCRSNLECKALNSATDVFVCVGAPTGHCLTPRPFQGADCSKNQTNPPPCPANEQCFDVSPYGILTQHGECRVPCDADGKCPARGGLPHVCFGANHEGGCYPSSFGTPCTADSDCIADFTCRDAKPDTHSRTGYSAKICTIPCLTDADCDADSWTKKRGFCSEEGICRLGGGDGTNCDRDAQCASRRCDEPTTTCVPVAGP